MNLSNPFWACWCCLPAEPPVPATSRNSQPVLSNFIFIIAFTILPWAEEYIELQHTTPRSPPTPFSSRTPPMASYFPCIYRHFCYQFGHLLQRDVHLPF